MDPERERIESYLAHEAEIINGSDIFILTAWHIPFVLAVDMRESSDSSCLLDLFPITSLFKKSQIPDFWAGKMEIEEITSRCITRFDRSRPELDGNSNSYVLAGLPITSWRSDWTWEIIQKKIAKHVNEYDFIATVDLLMDYEEENRDKGVVLGSPSIVYATIWESTGFKT